MLSQCRLRLELSLLETCMALGEMPTSLHYRPSRLVRSLHADHTHTECTQCLNDSRDIIWLLCQNCCFADVVIFVGDIGNEDVKLVRKVLLLNGTCWQRRMQYACNNAKAHCMHLSCAGAWPPMFHNEVSVTERMESCWPNLCLLRRA